MLISYIKFAIRNIFRNKVFSMINIFGLAIGLASCFIILIYVMNEFSFDKHNKQLDDIYLVTSTYENFNNTTPATPFMLGPSLKEQFPQITSSARWLSYKTTVKHEDESFVELHCIYADPSLFDILTFSIVEGKASELTENQNAVIISRQVAEKYFGSSSPLGKLLTINNSGGTYDVIIAGIMKNIPETSTFRADIILSLNLAKAALRKNWSTLENRPLESRHLCLVNNYILLSQGMNVGEFEQQLKKVSDSYSDDFWKVQFNLFPVKDIYFYSGNMINNHFPTGDISNIYIYSVIGILILLIACINMIIINTGIANKRTKEIGVRKVVGAGKLDLIKQLFVESSLYAIISLPIAIGLVELFLPVLSAFLGNEVSSGYFHNWQFMLIFMVTSVIIGILSGVYISVYLIKLRPIDILRNELSAGLGKARFRKTMVAVQMVIVIGLIIAFITVNKQINYFHNKDFGFNKNNLVIFESDYSYIGKRFEEFKNELHANSNVIGVTGSFNIPASEGRGTYLIPSKLNPSVKIPVEGMSVDRDFLKVMEMKILDGENFSDLTRSELKSACILNEKALHELGIKNPLDEYIEDKKIVGVVKDFNQHSLREFVGPMILTCSTKYINEIAIRISSVNMSNTIKFIQKISKDFNNGKPMAYEFFDRRIDSLYGDEKKFSEMIGFFAGLAIFIACLGLFGISLYASRQRVKEIGIRKIMGASTRNIFYLLIKEFIVLTAISTVIAVPIVIYLLNIWLQNFAYKIGIDIWTIIISALASLVITLTTVGIHAIQAATVNPVESLKYE